MKPSSEELLKKVDDILESEGSVNSMDMSAAELLDTYILPAMQQSKSTLGSIYDFEPRKKSGFAGKLRNKIINKIKNVVVSTMEKPMIKQQKYNELLFKAVEALVEENKSLKSKKPN